MERRVRLVLPPDDLRSWCLGASLPLDPPSLPGVHRTHFLRVHGLMERIRSRRGLRRAAPAASLAPEPLAPLPQVPTSASDADALPQPSEAAR